MRTDPTGGGGRSDRAQPSAVRDRRPVWAGPPVVLVAHGSPDPRSRAVVRDIAAAADATAAFLDFDSPHPVAVLKDLADAGHRHATVIPLLLTHAYHGRVDVPRIAVEATHARPRLSIEVTAPVGGPHLIPALLRSLRLTNKAVHGSRAADAVVLASAGTRDSDTLDRLTALASDLDYASGLPTVAAYASAAKPSVAEAIEGLRKRGHHRIAVASYFIAPGVLHDRVVQAATEAGAAVTPPLGACPELVAAIASRHAGPVGYSTPTDSRVDGSISSTAVPPPTTHAAIA